MDTGTLYLILGVLAFGLALNLKLTLAVLNASRNAAAAANTPFTLPEGERIPSVPARGLQGGATLALDGEGQPSVLLFLSSTCPKCRAKLPEIATLLPLAQEAGVDLRLVSREPAWRLRRFLAGTPLAAVAARVSTKGYQALNPTMTSPYYVFLDEQARVQAGGIIGDENWSSFQAQLEEQLLQQPQDTAQDRTQDSREAA